MTEILTAKEAAKRLNVNVFTLYAWARKRKLKSIRFGTRLRRFSAEEIQRFIDKSSIAER